MPLYHSTHSAQLSEGLAWYKNTIGHFLFSFFFWESVGEEMTLQVFIHMEKKPSPIFLSYIYLGGKFGEISEE